MGDEGRRKTLQNKPSLFLWPPQILIQFNEFNIKEKKLVWIRLIFILIEEMTFFHQMCNLCAYLLLFTYLFKFIKILVFPIWFFKKSVKITVS